MKYDICKLRDIHIAAASIFSGKGLCIVRFGLGVERTGLGTGFELWLILFIKILRQVYDFFVNSKFPTNFAVRSPCVGLCVRIVLK